MTQTNSKKSTNKKAVAKEISNQEPKPTEAQAKVQKSPAEEEAEKNAKLAAKIAKLEKNSAVKAAEESVDDAALDFRANPTKDNEKKVKEERTKLNAAKRKVKADCLKLEETNREYLYLYRSTKDFYKIIGASLVFYAKDVAERINRRFNILVDSDSYSRSETGTISVKNIMRLAVQLCDAKIEVDEAASAPDIIAFKFPEPYTDEWLDTMQKLIIAEQTKVIDMIVPKNPFPELFKTMRDFGADVRDAIDSIKSPLIRETYNPTIMEDLFQHHLSYVYYANGKGNVSYLRPEIEATIAKKDYLPISPETKNIYNLVQYTRKIKETVLYLASITILKAKLIDRITVAADKIGQQSGIAYQKAYNEALKKIHEKKSK